jgi:hypothetical protein
MPEASVEFDDDCLLVVEDVASATRGQRDLPHPLRQAMDALDVASIDVLQSAFHSDQVVEQVLEKGTVAHAPATMQSMADSIERRDPQPDGFREQTYKRFGIQALPDIEDSVLDADS